MAAGIRCKIQCRVLYYVSESIATIPGTTCAIAGYDKELFCCGSPGQQKQVERCMQPFKDHFGTWLLLNSVLSFKI